MSLRCIHYTEWTTEIATLIPTKRAYVSDSLTLTRIHTITIGYAEMRNTDAVQRLISTRVIYWFQLK